MIKTLMAQVKQYKKVTVATPIFTMLEVLMEVIIPLVTASIIDDGIEAGNIRHVYQYGAYMLILAMVSLLFAVLAGRFAADASSGFAANVREAMYGNIQKYSFANIDNFSTAGLVTRLTTDVTNLQNAFQMILRMCVRAPFMLVCAMAACFSINAKLSLVFVVAIIFLLIALACIVKNAMGTFREVFRKYDDLNASVQENVSAIRVVKAYVREDHEKKKFTAAAENLYRLFVRAEGTIAFNGPVMMTAVYGSIIGISWFGSHYIVGGTLSTGDLSAMLNYVMQIMMSLMMLSMVFVMITMSAASARRVAEVISENSDITNPEHPVTEVIDGSIVFRDVHFAYKNGTGKDTLSDIDLEIKTGETIGIIGGTGSGKSSLVNLISRLYDVKSGEVLVGGVNVKDYDIETLRNAVSVVLQKNVLFSGTILDNLRWGNENATQEECMHACRLACADEFIRKMPDGYSTYIEQGGTNVSGGQKQRLCIARALLKKPKVLILDDSTSAVDTATDAKIRKAFAQEIADTTKIIIAQRISSVAQADRVIVMDDGRVDAFDAPENLLKNNKIYREVYESQISGGDFDRQGGED